jgi:hypothetical protein
MFRHLPCEKCQQYKPNHFTIKLKLPKRIDYPHHIEKMLKNLSETDKAFKSNLYMNDN